jgi:hypothetical protein
LFTDRCDKNKKFKEISVKSQNNMEIFLEVCDLLQISHASNIQVIMLNLIKLNKKLLDSQLSFRELQKMLKLALSSFDKSTLSHEFIQK